jgi:hypothetical protein
VTRIRTDGAEIAANTSDTGMGAEYMGWYPASAAVTRDTSIFRSGAASYKLDSTSGSAQLTTTRTTFANQSYSQRFYMRATQANASPFYLNPPTGGNNAAIQFNTNGTLSLTVGGTVYGGSSPSVIDGAWHRIEMKVQMGATNATYIAAELQVDGVSIGVFSGSYVGVAPTFSIGVPTGTGVVNIDDLALNDSVGTAGQTSWCGEGKIVLLKAVADNARGSNWVSGGGGTTNLWDAVDNIPPAGIATPGNATSQVRNASSAATQNYDATLQSYTVAGVPAVGAILTVVQGLICTCTLNAVDPNQGLVLSNPAGSSNQMATSAAAGTWPTNWRWQQVTSITTPATLAAVALGTGPVMRVQRINTGGTFDVCFMGVYAEYVLSPPVVAAVV